MPVLVAILLAPPTALADANAPTVSKIERKKTATGRTNANTLTWTVTLGETVTGVDPTNFKLTTLLGRAPLYALAVTGSRTTYVNVTGANLWYAGYDCFTLGYAAGQNTKDTESTPISLDLTTTPDPFRVDHDHPKVTITGVPTSTGSASTVPPPTRAMAHKPMSHPEYSEGGIS